MELKDEYIATIYVEDEGFYDNLADLKSRSGPTSFIVVFKNGHREELDYQTLIKKGLIKKIFLTEEQINIKTKEILDSNEQLLSVINSKPSIVTGVMPSLGYLTKEKAYEIAQDYYTYHWA